MKKILSFVFILVPIVVIAATISGQVIDNSSSQGIENITVIVHRFEPYSWENVSFSATTNDEGSFTIEDVVIGQYRLYTAYNDNYFTEYLSESIEILNENQSVTNIDLYLEAIIAGRGSISGNINSEDLFLEHTSYFMTLKYMPTDDYVISMGFQEINEDMTYSYENLNTGNYKVGILFYGQFNGEIWYDTVFSEDEAQVLIVNPENPAITDIDFEISFDTLNQPYLHVENVIIDYGSDNILTNGEVFTVAYQVKNVGNLPSNNSTFFSYSPYQDVNMETVTQELSLLADQEVTLGPYEVTIDYNIENDFDFHLFYSISDAFSHNSSPIFLTAYAPQIEISSYEIITNNGDIRIGSNTISLEISNRGGAHVNYPLVNISTDDDSIILGNNYQTNAYWLEAEVGHLEFIFDFELLESSYYSDELNFEINFGSLNTDMMHIIDFVVPIQLVTSNPQDIEQVEIISLSNYPNPFNPETTISFNLTESANVYLDIYNIQGQLVKRLISDNLEKGNHQVVWKGKNQRNQQVTSGIYFYKLHTNNSHLIRKMLLSK